MRWLRNLTDTDKHRIVLPAVTLPSEGNLKFAYVGGEGINIIGHVKLGHGIKPGTKLATIIVAKNSTKDVSVTGAGQVTSMPVFPVSLVPPVSSFDAISVEFALGLIRLACTEVIDEIGAQL